MEGGNTNVTFWLHFSCYWCTGYCLLFQPVLLLLISQMKYNLNFSYYDDSIPRKLDNVQLVRRLTRGSSEQIPVPKEEQGSYYGSFVSDNKDSHSQSRSWVISCLLTSHTLLAFICPALCLPALKAKNIFPIHNWTNETNKHSKMNDNSSKNTTKFKKTTRLY